MKEYHRKIIDQLDSLLENNPKKYWSLLDDIANKTDNNKTPDNTAGTWFDHFSNLIKKTNFSGKELIGKLEVLLAISSNKDQYFLGLFSSKESNWSIIFL
jgi:hypothetical protein